MKKDPLSQKITAVLWSAADPKELKSILEDLLTPAELKDLVERIAIVKALMDESPQRKVAKKLGVSLSKVSRGSLLLQTGKGALARVLASYSRQSTDTVKPLNRGV